MKKMISIIITSAFLAGSLIIACDSTSKKVEDARVDVQTSKENVQLAQNDLNKAVQDSIQEFQKFKMESEGKIIAYEKSIAGLKIQIAKEKKYNKTKYQKMIAELEQRNLELKKNLSEYKNEQRNEWNEFKVEFSKDVDNLGTSISNFFKDDKK